MSKSFTFTIPTIKDAAALAKAGKDKAAAYSNEFATKFKEGYEEGKKEASLELYVKELESRVLNGYIASMKQAALTAHLEGELAKAGVTAITSPFTWPTVDTTMVKDSLHLARINAGL